MQKITDTKCKCKKCGWYGIVGACQPDIDRDGNWGCPYCSSVVTIGLPKAPNIYKFPQGLTVTELKEIIKDWPKTDTNGDPTTIWIETGRGLDSIVTGLCPVDLTDMELTSSAFENKDNK